jgi:hypothetical protein
LNSFSAIGYWLFAERMLFAKRCLVFLQNSLPFTTWHSLRHNNLSMNYRLWSLVAALSILIYSSTASAQTITSWKVRTASPSGFESTNSLPVGAELRMQVISGSGADVVVLADTSRGFTRMASWSRPFLNQVLKLKTDEGGAAGNPFLVQVGGGNASLQPVNVKRSAGYEVLTFAGGWRLKVKVVSDF